MKYRAEIDGLRALAVLSVVLFHAFPAYLRGGFIGVDIFFVISGYLITKIILEEIDSNKFSFFSFFGRRVRRIFPALFVVSGMSLIFGWFVLLADEYAQLGKHVASGAAFILNFVLVEESGYFDTAAETKPMLHLWSLAVEEQFYLFWPLVIWLAWKFSVNVLILAVIVAAFSFSLNLYFVDSKPVHTFFWPVGRFWELLCGSIIAWLVFNNSERFRTISLYVNRSFKRDASVRDGNDNVLENLMSLLGFVLIVYGVFRVNEDLSFPGKWALIPVIGAVLLIVAGSKAWLNRTILMNPVAVWFGLISYPLYLWHWPILSFLQIVEDGASEKMRLLAVLISIALAWLTYKYIEVPVRFGSHKKHAVSLLSLAVLTVGACGVYVYDAKGVYSRYAMFAEGEADFERLSKISEAWEFSGYPKPEGMFKDPVLDLNRIGLNDQSKVLMIGDSHTKQYWNSFGYLSEIDNPDSKSIVFKSVKFLPDIEEVPIDMDESIDSVAISFYWALRYGSDKVAQELRCCGSGKNRTIGYVGLPYKNSNQMDDVDNKLRQFIFDLKSRGLKVFIVLDNPFGEELNAQSMIFRDGFEISVQPNMILTKSEAIKRAEPVRSRVVAIANELGAEIIDPMQHLCDENVCHIFSENNDLLYKDYDHISLYAARNSVDYIRLVLE